MTEETKEKHHQIDPIFKQVVVNEFAGYQAGIQTEVEVSRLPRTIDVVVTVGAQAELQRIRIETPFFYFLRYNQMEFKGRADPLTSTDIHLIAGRTQLYLGEQGVSVQEMTVTILCAGKPRTVLTYTEKFRPFRQIEAGYYKNDDYPAVYLLVINELPIVLKNYPLLLFASSERKFRKFLEEVVAKGEFTYLRYAYEVRPRLTREIVTMAGISANLSKEDLQFMAEDIGRELMAFLPPAERLAGISVDERLAGVSTNDRLSGISTEELLKAIDAGALLHELSPDHRKALIELLATMQSANRKEKKTQR